jgi:hypothetical protein
MNEHSPEIEQSQQTPKESLLDLIRQDLVANGVIDPKVLSERLPDNDSEKRSGVGKLTGLTHTGIVTPSNGTRAVRRGTISRL